MAPELRPPAQPTFVLRGHSSQIHTVKFSPTNTYLLTGDAEGWVICWGVIYKRPLAVWKAHNDAVLGLSWWDEDTVISHGRDSKLIAWDLEPLQKTQFDTMLPIEGQSQELRKPEMLYELTLNTLNFCAFASCSDPTLSQGSNNGARHPLLLAVPHILDSEAIDIFQLPSTSRLGTIPAPKSPEMGMAMALSIHSTPTHLFVLAGYESGHALVFAHPFSTLKPAVDPSRPSLYPGPWTRTYSAQPHSQPILSLAVSIDRTCFITTSADANVAKHPLDEDVPDLVGNAAGGEPIKIVKTKHSGQQGLSVRSDGKIFATAGWDGRVRVYSAKTSKELAVLKWHRDGCYACDFATVWDEDKLNSRSGRNDQKRRAVESQVEETLESELVVGSSERTNAEEKSGQTDSLAKRNESSTGNEGLDEAEFENQVIHRAQHGSVTTRRATRDLQTHYLAVGAKDGKVSLWDVF